MGEHAPIGGKKALGHFALHYRPGDSGMVVRLFRSLGLTVEDFGPSLEGLLVADAGPGPDVDRAFRVIIDPDSPDGFFFCCTATRPQLDLEDAMAAIPPEAFEQYRKARDADPEASFHIGIRYAALGDLERALGALDTAIEEEPGLRGRVRVTRMKAHSATDPAVAERMAASPFFQAGDRDAFVEGAVQVFIQTDVAAGGLLRLGQTIELDYVFPGPAVHFPPAKVYEPL